MTEIIFDSAIHEKTWRYLPPIEDKTIDTIIAMLESTKQSILQQTPSAFNFTYSTVVLDNLHMITYCYSIPKKNLLAHQKEVAKQEEFQKKLRYIKYLEFKKEFEEEVI